jgi:hypothetical protein
VYTVSKAEENCRDHMLQGLNVQGSIIKASKPGLKMVSVPLLTLQPYFYYGTGIVRFSTTDIAGEMYRYENLLYFYLRDLV